MKKFAVIISGQVRTLNRSFLDYLEKININYDVYIHYWSAENNSYENCGNLYNRHNIKNVPSNLHDKIIEVYNPKKIIFENQIIFDFNKNYIDLPTNLMQNTISQFYGIYKAFNLIDNINNYTHIIKIRFDFKFINFDDNLHDIDNHSLYFLETNHLNDILWIVPINLIHIFSLYNYMYESSNIFNTTPENIIHFFLSENNIIPKKINGNCIIDRDYIN